MKIYGICVIKNEADIISHVLSLASNWADKIIVFDNGSSDGTWEKVKAMNNPKIIPYKQDTRPYSDGLRAEIFNNFKSELNEGDWWVIQDGDEIYEQNPREFIQNQKGQFHHINGRKVDFCFDLSRIDELDFAGDFSKDEHLFNFYTPEIWSEPRAIKHRAGLKWEVKKIWPSPMGLVCEQTIPISHYPLRSTDQIKSRWITRYSVKNSGGQSFNHWEKENWRGYYEKKMETLLPVNSKSDVFETSPFMNEYRHSFLKKLAKQILHGTGILPGILMAVCAW